MSESTKPSIDLLHRDVQWLYAQVPLDAFGGPHENTRLHAAIDELAALREWRAKAEPLLRDIWGDMTDEDVCYYCDRLGIGEWVDDPNDPDERIWEHGSQCPIARTEALLGEAG